MSGTQHGRLEMFAATDDANTTRDIFSYLVTTIDANTSWTRIASNYGSGGTGFGITGSGNPSGENAFAVWRCGKYHLLMQWSWASAMGTAPGNPGTCPGAKWIAMQIAYDNSGGTSVWGGGVANAGADAKSSPIWVVNGGDLIVHPRSNGNAGSQATNKEGMINIYGGGVNSRLQFLIDNDTIIVAHDAGNDASYNCITYIGPYVLADDMDLDGDPIVMLQSIGTPVITDNIGTINLSAHGLEGGTSDSGYGIITVAGSRIFRLTWDASLTDILYQPNYQRAIETLDAQKARICLRDTNGGNTYGYIGYLPTTMRLVYNIATHTTDVDKYYIYLGNSTTASVKWRIPWDGDTIPGTGITVAGVTF